MKRLRPSCRLDDLTRADYLLVMSITVGTAELKAHLSEHLQAVRRGETIIVLDRKEPIAQIVPIGTTHNGLVIRPAKGSIQDVPLPEPRDLGFDVLEQLWEERADRF